MDQTLTRTNNKSRTGNRSRIGPVPPGFLLRGEIMQRLGLTNRKFNSLIQDGTLKAARHNHRRWALYSEEDAERVHRILTARLRRNDLDSVTYTAEECAAVFKRLDEGRTFSSIVIELKLHAYTVQALMREYARGSGGLLLTKVEMDRINRLPLEGVTLPIASGEQIIVALEAACAEKRCSCCKTRARTSKCAFCIRKEAEPAIRKSIEQAAAKAAAAKPAESTPMSEPSSSAVE